MEILPAGLPKRLDDRTAIYNLAEVTEEEKVELDDDAGGEELVHEQEAVFQEHSRTARLPQSASGYTDNLTGEALPSDLVE